MGANAQIKVPAFTAGQVLTAAEMTQINTGIPVFATTVTRDAAFDGAGEKTLAAGQFAFVEATNTTQYYNGTAWVPVGGLSLVKAQVIGSAVAAVTVSNVFSATYDNYRIIVSNMASGGGGAGLSFTLNGSAGSTYEGNTIFWSTVNATITNQNYTAQAAATCAILSNTRTMAVLDVTAPFLVSQTMFTGTSTSYGSASTDYSGLYTWYDTNAASSVSFTLTPTAGTLTGGTVYVYGYSNS